MKNNRGLYLQFLLSSVCLFLLWSCNAKQAAETSAEKIEKPVIEKPVVKTTEGPDSVDEFAEEESSGGEESDNSSLADQLLEFQFSTFAPSEKESGKALTEVEKRRLLATAKILQAARTTVPDPGPYKLVELEGGAEVWQARGDKGQFGGVLTLSTFGSGPKTFNVWAANDAQSHGLGLLMFDPLVEVDAWTGEMQPKLAKSFKLSDDKLEYTITLRNGLVWSDGHPLTADDVIYTFNTLIKKGYGAGSCSARDTLAHKGFFPEVTKVDNLTVKFKTREPFSPFLNGIHNVAIAPKHILSAITKKPMQEFHGFWDINCDPETMVVSGPFKLKRYVAGQRVEMVRNSRYSMVDKDGRRLPYLDKFVEVIVPDQNTQILKFYGGELDFLDIKSVRGLDAALMKQREKTNNFTMYNLGPDDGTTFIMFNMNRRNNPETGKPYVNPMKRKWFNNLYFRQAVSHAIDRQKLVDNILKGVGIPIFAHYSAGSLWYAKDLKHYGQDLNLAKQLLEKGGFQLKDKQLFDSDDNPVEFVLQTNSGNSARDGTCVMIQNDLAKLGIKVNYQPVDFNILINAINHKLDWDAVLMGLTGNKIEPYDSANVWKSGGRMHMFDQRLPDSEGNVSVTDARIWEKEIDQCFDQGATTFDSKKRHQFFDKFQAIAYDKVPFIYLYSMLDIAAARNTIGNYRPTPIGIYYTPKGTFHNIEEIYKTDGGK